MVQHRDKQKSQQQEIKVLERGDIYFVYRPKVEEQSVEGLEDVQRFYMILSPRNKKRYRLIVIGQKKLPEISNGGQKYWGFVEKVGREAKELKGELERQTYQTKTRGERIQPAVRPAGEGVYAIVYHENHTHLAYALELPDKPGAVQQALNIEEEGSYIISVKNPERASPRGTGLDEERQADFPKRLQNRFKGRRFIEIDPPEFLDHEGAELLFIGAAEDVSEELGLELDPERETENTAEIFNNLRLDKSRHPTKPLFKGEWA